MTTNQLEFAKLRESQRHNVETETQGRRKLAQDYEIGSRQAGAAESQAVAAHKNAGANLINAATRQEELAWDQTQYYDTGRDSIWTKNDLVRAQTEAAIASANKTQAEQKGVDYANSKRGAYGYWLIDTTGEMINNLIPSIITVGDLN